MKLFYHVVKVLFFFFCIAIFMAVSFMLSKEQLWAAVCAETLVINKQ